MSSIVAAMGPYEERRREIESSSPELRPLRAAQATGETCGICGRAFEAAESVYMQSIGTPHVSLFGEPIYEDAVVCVDCCFDAESIWRWKMTKDCPVCGRTVSYRDWRVRAGGCSQRCRRTLEAHRKREARAGARELRARSSCATCGDTFTPSRSDARFCSSACRQRAYRARLATGAA